MSEDHFIYINFEDMTNAHLCTAEAFHAEMQKCISALPRKAYLFLDEIDMSRNGIKHRNIRDFLLAKECD